MYKIVDNKDNVLVSRFTKWNERRIDRRSVVFSLFPKGEAYYLNKKTGKYNGFDNKCRIFIANRQSALNYIATYKQLRWSPEYCNEYRHVESLQLRIQRVT